MNMTLLRTRASQRWVLVILAFLFYLTPALVGQLWLEQPFILIGAGVLATQVANQIGKSVLLTLAKTHSEAPESESTTTHNLEMELKGALTSRAKPSAPKAAEAVDSYLSQTVGSWAMVVLILGFGVLLLVRWGLLGVGYPKWLLLLVMLAIIATGGTMVWLTAKGGLGSTSLAPYYDRPDLFPPFKENLTKFRMTVLLIYSLSLVSGLL